ncbi:unnamed protein product [Hymenolepis diminuta]|uniref:Uncharacterized protein n=1 Tax=Hymenolepis diminuta TaxID=6216 RepID=A0A564YYK1_HYMDI|nr:unnamed protein product [Hymenolepis diminuta]
MEKLQKQRDLNLEYQKFKAMDEERFRNRFAEKKVIKFNQTASDPIKQIEDQAANVNINNNMEVLLKRLDILQQNVEDLKKPQLESNHIQDNIPPVPINTYQPNIIDDAIKRLNELEGVIKTMNLSENNKSDKESSESNTKTNKFSIKAESFTKVNEEPASLERLKQIEKQRYANELKQQIEEKHRQRELQKQREREEDLIKMAETRDYDSLGHRIRDKPTEASFTNSNLVSERRPENFARGGNGIFGAPLTESQKIANRNYRNELMLQIEEKRLKEEKRKQEQKELEVKELQKVINDTKSLSCPNPSESFHCTESSELTQIPLPPKNEIRKQSACVQVALERQSSRPKATKVVRNPPLREELQKSPKMDEVLAQITQLKVELAAEKLRMGRDRAETLDTIHVYDPRLVDLKRPIKVHRSVATSNKIKTKQRSDRKVVLCSSSEFLPQSRRGIIPQSPSLEWLNLDETNDQMKQGLEQLKINESLDDLYRNEPPIIRDFMAEEEPKLIANSGYY